MDHNNTLALIAIIVAAGSEILAILPGKPNSWLQLIFKALVVLFPRKR